MVEEFKSINELYERVKPALRVKVNEARRKDLNDINEIDVWNYLTEKKWKVGKNLMICDIVSDIINLDLDLLK